MSEKDIEQTKALVENFNKLDESIQDKLLIGVKGLVFLQSLANHANAQDEPATPAIEEATA